MLGGWNSAPTPPRPHQGGYWVRDQQHQHRHGPALNTWRVSHFILPSDLTAPGS